MSSGKVGGAFKAAAITMQAVSTMKKFAENKRRESLRLAEKMRPGKVARQIVPMEGFGNEEEEEGEEESSGGSENEGTTGFQVIEAPTTGGGTRRKTGAPRLTQLQQEDALLAEMGAVAGGEHDADAGTVDALLEQIDLES